MNLKYHLFILLLIALVTATACTPDDVDSTAFVMEKYRARVADLTGNLKRDCQEDVFKEAIRLADSLLIDRARRMRRIDGRPLRPNRPGAPPVKELSEPLPLRPLFPFEIRFDTILRYNMLLDSLHSDSIDKGLLPPLDLDPLNDD
ncbi:MAG: hypothetical protein OTI34_17665 [Lewinella sp.]|jgi:hypothetical protein|nr:hypothetical protein [Lewinella sp.]